MITLSKLKTVNDPPKKKKNNNNNNNNNNNKTLTLQCIFEHISARLNCLLMTFFITRNVIFKFILTN
jgi:hypothetical protein